MKPDTPTHDETASGAGSTEIENAGEGRFAYEGLNRVIHERARLSVLTSLLTHPKGLTFNELKQLCSLTDGNLSRHLSILEKSEMIQVLKSHDRNRPLTLCKVTSTGRKRYLEYLATLEQVIRDAEESTRRDTVRGRKGRLAPSGA